MIPFLFQSNSGHGHRWPWAQEESQTVPLRGIRKRYNYIYTFYIYTKIYIVYTGFCLEDVDVKKNILDESISGRFLIYC